MRRTWKNEKEVRDFYLGRFPNKLKRKRAERKQRKVFVYGLESVGCGVDCCCAVECEEEEEREVSMSHALLQVLPNWGK